MSLRREPAVLAGILVAIVQAVTAFVLVNDVETAALVNAAAAAIAGAVVGFLVKADNLLPLLTGAAQAVIACLVGFGLEWTSVQQASLMAPIALIAAYVVRDRVTAPVPAQVVTPVS